MGRNKKDCGLCGDGQREGFKFSAGGLKKESATMQEEFIFLNVSGRVVNAINTRGENVVLYAPTKTIRRKLNKLFKNALFTADVENLDIVSVSLPKDELSPDEVSRWNDEHETKPVKTTTKIWTSDLKILDAEDLTVIIPDEIQKVCLSLAFRNDNEFSVLGKAQRKDKKITLSELFYIPKQKVHSTSTTITDTSDLSGWNVHIHKHPDGIKSFSGADLDFSSANFEVSLLFCAGDFCDGRLNITLKTGEKLRIPLTHFETHTPALENIPGVENIEPEYVYKYDYKPHKKIKWEEVEHEGDLDDYDYLDYDGGFNWNKWKGRKGD